MPRLLILFSLVNLVIGSGAFVVAGILQPIATDLGVGIPAAGQAMTAYALATALLAPPMLVATGRWPRKHALLLALALFTLGNLVCALAPSLAVLLAGRVLMGLGAMFTPIAAGIAVALVEPARRGKALAFVFLGISLSYVVGLPLGSWLGLRFGWHAPIALIAALGAAALVLVALKVPASLQVPGASFEGLGGLLRRGEILRTLLLTLLYFTAIFCVFAYIGPVLQSLRPMSPGLQSFTLMLFGLSGVAGTLVGGWANDHFGTRRTLVVQLSLLGTMMALVPLTAGSLTAIVTVLLVWGVCGFGMMAPQQARLVSGAPAQAPLLLSLNTSMLYIGTALGAALGGLFAAPLGFDRLAWIGVPLALLGLLTLVVGRRRPSPAMS
ncbi:MFS transporter [Rivibacter subsaxonicus]|uniref:DHA1 family inner membrane transport protein n=1 Tax=Rivibacter subsaxonicus TaxID=457575 RepID=A0A4Q7W277_9BURK|nr:MFS transporter [Rivibacter subsaxonicus]RZU03108.1 DHA1 family inner membrane transport protein [Rivibacter subsaxonicus]